MTERNIDTTMWTNDEWFQSLDYLQKLLFLYMWTNDHCNSAGVYEITVKTISDETSIPNEEIRVNLPLLHEKVQWWPEHNVIWVKNFVKRQSKSPTFLQSVAKCLRKIKQQEICEVFMDYNNTLLIPYEYPTNTLSIPPIYDEKNRVSIPSISVSFSGINTNNNIYNNNNIYIYTYYGENFGKLSDEIIRDIEILVNEYSGKMVFAAMKEAKRVRKCSMGYVNGILNNWRQDGSRNNGHGKNGETGKWSLEDVELKCISCGNLQIKKMVSGAANMVRLGKVDIAALKRDKCVKCGEMGNYEYSPGHVAGGAVEN